MRIQAVLARRGGGNRVPRMRMRGFSFDVEMLWIGRELGYSICEVPINWTHMAGSKVNVVRDGMRMVADLVRIRQNAMRGLYGKALDSELP